MMSSQRNERFSVLSIDGGGVRGIFVAAVLASLERDIGVKITDLPLTQSNVWSMMRAERSEP